MTVAVPLDDVAPAQDPDPGAVSPAHAKLGRVTLRVRRGDHPGDAIDRRLKVIRMAERFPGFKTHRQRGLAPEHLVPAKTVVRLAGLVIPLPDRVAGRPDRQGESLGGLPQGLLGLLAVGDVHVHAGESLAGALPGDLEDARQTHSLPAVPATKGKLGRTDRLSRAANKGNRIAKHRRLVRGQDQLLDAPADRLAGGITVEQFGRLVPQDDASVGIEPLDGHVGSVADDRREALLALPPRLFGQHAVGHVIDVAVPEDAAIRLALGDGVPLQPAKSPLREIDAILATPGLHRRGRSENRFRHSVEILGMNPMKHQFRREPGFSGRNLVNLPDSLAGVRKTTLSVGPALELINHPGHLLREFSQERVTGAQLLLKAPAIGNIGVGPDQFLGDVVPANHQAVRLDPDPGAVRATKPVFRLHGAPFPGQAGFERRHGGTEIIRMHQGGQVLEPRRHALDGEAGHLSPLLGEVHPAGRNVPLKHTGPGPLEGEFPALLAFPKGVGGQALGRDVDHDAVPGQAGAGPVGLRHRPRTHPPDGSILRDQAILARPGPLAAGGGGHRVLVTGEIIRMNRRPDQTGVGHDLGRRVAGQFPDAGADVRQRVLALRREHKSVNHPGDRVGHLLETPLGRAQGRLDLLAFLDLDFQTNRAFMAVRQRASDILAHVPEEPRKHFGKQMAKEPFARQANREGGPPVNRLPGDDRIRKSEIRGQRSEGDRLRFPEIIGGELIPGPEGQFQQHLTIVHDGVARGQAAEQLLDGATVGITNPGVIAGGMKPNPRRAEQWSQRTGTLVGDAQRDHLLGCEPDIAVFHEDEKIVPRDRIGGLAQIVEREAEIPSQVGGRQAHSLQLLDDVTGRPTRDFPEQRMRVRRHLAPAPKDNRPGAWPVGEQTSGMRSIECGTTGPNAPASPQGTFYSMSHFTTRDNPVQEARWFFPGSLAGNSSSSQTSNHPPRGGRRLNRHTGVINPVNIRGRRTTPPARLRLQSD